MTDETPKAPTETAAKQERQALRKGLDETEAPTRTEATQPTKAPRDGKGEKGSD